MKKVLLPILIASLLFSPFSSHAALIDDLISYWKMDEVSGTRADSHGSNTLADNNTVGSGTGIISNGTDMESGSSEYLSISDASQSGLDETGDMSISMWANFESEPAFVNLVQKGYEGNVARAYNLNWEPNILIFQVSNDGNGGAAALVNFNPTGATWYHLVAVYDVTAPAVKFYVNGSQVTSGAAGTPETPIFSGAGVFGVGGSSAGGYFDGIIDEVGFWSRELTAGEVTELYNAGAGLAYPFSAPASGESFGHIFSRKPIRSPYMDFVNSFISVPKVSAFNFI